MQQISNKNKLTNTKLFLYLFIYKVIIEIVYIFLISPRYGYGGLNLDINYKGYFISLIPILVVSVFSPKNQGRPSTYIFFILTIFTFVPVTAFYWLNNQSANYLWIISIGLICIALILKIKPLNLNIRSNTAKIWLITMFIFYIVITIFLIYRRGGIDSRAFSFDSIYSLRSETNLTGIWGYFLNWSTKAFAPFFFSYYFYYKKKSLLFGIIILQLLMYLSFGNKAFLFSIGLLCLMTFLMKRGNFIKEFTISMIALNISSYLTDNFLGIDILRRAIPYRLIFIPAQIQYQYYNFFFERSKLLFADGLIGKLFSINSPFNESISRVIGMYYSWDGLGTNANTGVFSDAYANGGVLGVIIISILLGIILFFIDSTTNKLPLYVVIGAFGYVTFVLNDTGLLTTFLTSGMGIIVMLLMVFNSSIVNSKINKCNQYNNSFECYKIMKEGIKND